MLFGAAAAHPASPDAQIETQCPKHSGFPNKLAALWLNIKKASPKADFELDWAVY